MKILGVRLAAFRRFAEPAAIEDFGDGVNLLCGPNEMGKSTMFQALEAAFLVRHKVSGAVLEGMRPYAGGEPLVEVDFEAQGGRWRIRKQFGRGASASLNDLNSGAAVARNTEAEERLSALTGASGDLPGSLGLVWVRQQRTLLAPDPDVDPASGKGKARGESAILRDVIGREIETAAFDETFEGVRERTKRALDVLATPSRGAAKKDGPLYNAVKFRDEAKARFEETREIAQAAEERLNRIAAMTVRLSELEAQAQSQAPGSGTAELEAQRAAALTNRAERDMAREAMLRREAELAAASGALAARKKSAEELVAKQTAFATARDLARQIEVWTAEIAPDLAAARVIDRLTALEQERALAEAELSGHAAQVDIALEESGRGRIEIGGSALHESRSFSVVEPLEIRIAGVGTIGISTAHAARGAELRKKSEAASAETAKVLADIGSATIEDARARSVAATRKQAELSGARAKFSGLAPRGLDALASDIAQLEAGLAADAAAVSEAQVELLKSAAMEARLTFNALAAQAMSDDDFRRLDAGIAAARNAEASRKTEIERLRQELAHTKGVQQAYDEEGRASELAAHQGEFERAEAEMQRLRHEAEALRLLERTLGDIEARAKAAYSAPISRRVARHLERVFGVSELTFRDDFAIDALRRADRPENVSLLSDGTREQLSLLVRLAFAEILAESGRGVPLVVDDPLAYSDDVRLAAVCAELAAATSVPQIIVLTCREKAFEILPGRRLKVTNWRPER